MIPLKILNRLNLGREVAAEVSPTSPGHKAWVLVWPRIDPAHGYMNKLSDYGEPLVFSTSDQNPILGFTIIFMQVEQVKLEKFIDNEWEMPYSSASTLQEDFAHDEAELEVKLSQWLSDFSLLQHPSAVGCRFCQHCAFLDHALKRMVPQRPPSYPHSLINRAIQSMARRSISSG